MSKSRTSHRGRAPGLKQSSTRHHRDGELEYGSGDHKKAAHEAMSAHSHGTHPSRHAEMVADEKVEHHGMDPVTPPEHETVDETAGTPTGITASATTSDATGDSADPHDAKVAVEEKTAPKARRKRSPRKRTGESTV